MFVACRMYSCIQIRRKICAFANVIYIVYLRMTKDIGSKARFMNLHRSSLFNSGSLSEEKDKKKNKKKNCKRNKYDLRWHQNPRQRCISKHFIERHFHVSLAMLFFERPLESFRRRSAVAAKRGKFPKGPRMR